MTKYNWVETVALNKVQKEALFQLWNAEYPAKIVYDTIADFEIYLNQLYEPHHYLLMNTDKHILGWAYTFMLEEETWFSILIGKAGQMKGSGKEILQVFKERESKLIRWVIEHDLEFRKDGTRYHSPIGFYLKYGFDVVRDQRLNLQQFTAVKIKWVRS
ncbi:MAG: N-acetyltransferase [Bacteroidia bacterium]|jgi:hypothetical protein